MAIFLAWPLFEVVFSLFLKFSSQQLLLGQRLNDVHCISSTVAKCEKIIPEMFHFFNN
jgi:hypothetical protein